MVWLRTQLRGALSEVLCIYEDRFDVWTLLPTAVTLAPATTIPSPSKTAATASAAATNAPAAPTAGSPHTTIEGETNFMGWGRKAFRQGYPWLRKEGEGGEPAAGGQGQGGNNGGARVVQGLSLVRRQLPAYRKRELRALQGWRYAVSVLLEASDVFLPLLRSFITGVGNFISFLLVRLIGRSLGLVYRGVLQSLRRS
eukprot:jgi/Mesvir1/1232/Mv15254-RA.1